MLSLSKPSILLFIATGIVFLLQLFPFTGVFLMMFGALFWATITINLAFICMIFEALFRVSPKWTLIFPALYFIGYLSVAGLSHYQYHLLQQQAATLNAKVEIPFDPIKNDLVVWQDYSTPLLSGYDLDVVYEPNETDIPMKHTSKRIASSEVCNTFRGYVEGIYTEPLWGRNTNGCVLAYSEFVAKPSFSVSSKFEKIPSWILPLERELVTITSPDNTKYTIHAGRVAPFPWLPRPVLGCALISSSATWECVHTFWRGLPQSIIGNPKNSSGTHLAIASALDLKPVLLEEKIARAPKSFDRSTILERNQKHRLDNTYKRFEAFLMDPVGYKDDLGFSLMVKERSYLASKADSMVNALKVLSSNSLDESNKRRVLYEFLSQIPKEDFAKVTPELITIFTPNEKSDPNLYSDLYRNPLLARMGDIGGAEVMMLYKSIFARIPNVKKIPGAVVLGICRGGSQMTDTFGTDLLGKLSAIKSEYQVDMDKRAILMALYRMGLKEQADRIMTFDDVHGENPSELTISPASPPSVCTFESGGGFPDFPI